MEFVCYDSLQQLPAGADHLFQQAERESLFLSRPWFENLIATGLDSRSSLLFATVVEEDRVLALLPLQNDAAGRVSALKHRYGSLYSMLLAKKDQPHIVQCLVDGLLSIGIHGLLLEPVAEDDANLKLLQQSLAAHGFQCDCPFRFYNWFLRLNGQSYSEYMHRRPSKLRNTIERKHRKLKREHTIEIHIAVGHEVPALMHAYYSVYGASWKAKELYRDFLDGMVARFSQQGWSRLGILSIDGQPIAAQLWFVVEKKASIFRLAYDQHWQHYSPGSILTAELMRHVIDEDQVKEIDFLVGNDAYKQDWMTERRERRLLGCSRPQERPNTISAVRRWIQGWFTRH
jgi:hypothetical protein